ncbi:MAG: radical SAM protein [Acidobacteriota bacterium]
MITQHAAGHVYGPVSSRRLGRSLGVDLVPFKTCTYDCVYCQLGRTTDKTTVRTEYVPADMVFDELQAKLATTKAVDHVTIAGSGEPTLNSRVGDLVTRIKALTSIPLAVLTNGSLLWIRDVQDALMDADLVLPSLDAGDENLFRYVNRPHSDIRFATMVDGLVQFRERFSGRLWLEVFLLGGVTGIRPEVERIAALVQRIRPERVQLNSVSRPPCEDFAFPVPARQMEGFADLFEVGAEVVCVERGEGEGEIVEASSVTDEAILALLKRRPCTARGVARGLGIHLSDATKRLHRLAQQTEVRLLRRHRRLFYWVDNTP